MVSLSVCSERSSKFLCLLFTIVFLNSIQYILHFIESFNKHHVITKSSLACLLLVCLLAADSAVDDTDSDSLSHITDGETAERRILREGLDAQRLGGDQLSHHGLSVLDEVGVLTEDLSGTLVDLSHDLLELAGNMGSVAILAQVADEE